MSPPDQPGGGPLATLTHARLRAEQGDLAGARRILDRILQRDPLNEEARRLRAALAGPAVPAGDGPAEEVPPPPLAGDPRRIAERFRRALGPAADRGRRSRIARLERWLARVSRRGPARG